jgi:hypothetical protein
LNPWVINPAGNSPLRISHGPCTKNVNKTNNTKLITIKLNIQGEKNTKPPKDIIIVPAVGLMVSVFSSQLTGRSFKSSHNQKIYIENKCEKSEFFPPQQENFTDPNTRTLITGPPFTSFYK